MVTFVSSLMFSRRGRDERGSVVERGSVAFCVVVNGRGDGRGVVLPAAAVIVLK